MFSEHIPKPGTQNRKRKSLGQCFLEDKNILALEAKLANPEHKTVLEIGAGDGRLTEKLLALSPKKIIAVEKDPKFAAILKEKFAKRGDTKNPEPPSRRGGIAGSDVVAGPGCVVEVVERDFLEFEFPDDVDVVIGNIPYYISSDIVFSLAPMRFERAVLMVQKEFARKMVAKPKDGNYGRLSVTSQLAFNITLERTVLRHLFNPVPKVDSAIVILTPTGIRLNQFQANVIRWLFQHKNKLVRNALTDSKMFDSKDLGVLGHFAKRRARTLSKEECLEIAGLLSK